MTAEQVGEDLLLTILTDIKNADGHIPENTLVHIQALLDIALLPDIKQIPSKMLHDPLPENDLSSVAQEYGEDELALFKAFESEYPQLPVELAHGFILRFIREINRPVVEVSIVDSDTPTTFEFVILSGLISNAERIVYLALQRRGQREEKMFRY